MTRLIEVVNFGPPPADEPDGEVEFTDAELAAIRRALRRLSGHGKTDAAQEAIARLALSLLIKAAGHIDRDDPPIAASLAMPAWNGGTLLTLMEVPHA